MRHPVPRGRFHRHTAIARPAEGSSPTVFLVLRRMRAPLIVLILQQILWG